jgi:nicotinamidase/pyrazinamidase
MKNKILIVVDYQYDFASPEGALYVPEAETILDSIQNQINDTSFKDIIYTMDTHDSNYNASEEAELFPPHCKFNTPGWDLYKIKTRNIETKIIIEEGVFESPKDFSIENEFVFMKDKFSIWEGNRNYEKFFTEKYDKDIEIVIAGVATNYCVFMNAMGYIERGYKNVTVVNNSVKGIKDDTYDKNIAIMKNNNIKFEG